LVSFFGGNPLLLVFFVGIGGNLVPFLPTPAMLVIVALITAPSSPFTGIGVVQIAAIAALGSSTGKFASYGLGYGARRALGRSQRFDSLKNRLGGSTFLVAMLFAASPLVDAALIPLGIMRYSAWKSFLSLYTGKFIWILSVLFVARTFHQVIVQTVGADIYAAIFSIGLVVSVAYLMIRIDWDKQVLDEKTGIGRLARRVKDLFSRNRSRNPASQAQRAQSNSSD
jgi:membrane protein YqaA with SNARE-associated domain